MSDDEPGFARAHRRLIFPPTRAAGGGRLTLCVAAETSFEIAEAWAKQRRFAIRHCAGRRLGGGGFRPNEPTAVRIAWPGRAMVTAERTHRARSRGRRRIVVECGGATRIVAPLPAAGLRLVAFGRGRYDRPSGRRARGCAALGAANRVALL